MKYISSWSGGIVGIQKIHFVKDAENISSGVKIWREQIKCSNRKNR